MMTNLKRIPLINSLLLVTTHSRTINASGQSQSPSDIRNACHIFNTLVAAKDLVHFLNSQTLGFWNAEVDPDDEDDAEGHEEVEGAEGDGFKHTRSD